MNIPIIEKSSSQARGRAYEGLRGRKESRQGSLPTVHYG
jgi:hypothetical protein